MKAYGSWSALRGDDQPRSWLRIGEIVAALQAEGLTVTEYACRKAIAAAGLPTPPKRYGHYQYGTEYLEAARRAARRMKEAS